MKTKNQNMTEAEQTAWYQVGLSADGVALLDWEKEAIVRYGRLLVAMQAGENMTPMEKHLGAHQIGKDHGVKLRVLLPAHTQFFKRVLSNMPKDTRTRIVGTVEFNGTQFEVCEFFRPKQSADTNLKIKIQNQI